MIYFSILIILPLPRSSVPPNPNQHESMIGQIAQKGVPHLLIPPLRPLDAGDLGDGVVHLRTELLTELKDAVALFALEPAIGWEGVAGPGRGVSTGLEQTPACEGWAAAPQSSCMKTEYREDTSHFYYL